MIAKAATLDADEVFLDLEDAVAPADKVAARAAAVAALRDNDFRAGVRSIRINAVSTPLAYRDIIELVAGAGGRFDTLIVPKVDEASHVHFVARLLDQLEEELGLQTPVGLELLIESTAGVSELRAIVRASERVEALVFGVGDYSVSLGQSVFEFGALEASYPGHQWHWVMSQIANEARAVGIQAIDGPFVDFHDPDGYRRSAEIGRLLGYQGKWCIHPSQISLANEAFGPTATTVAKAREIVAAYEEANQKGAGAVAIGGVMIDEATRKAAEQVLAQLERNGAPGDRPSTTNVGEP